MKRSTYFQLCGIAVIVALVINWCARHDTTTLTLNCIFLATFIIMAEMHKIEENRK